MKKNFLKFFLTTGVILSLGALAASCSDDDTNDPNKDKDKDKDKDKNNTYVTTEGPTPIRYVETKYIGSENGVTIEATEVTSDNIKFTCQPGADVVSYRVQLYPMGAAYNTMLNAMNSEKKESLTTTETDNCLFLMLLNTESAVSGGKLFNEKSYGDDFASYEFDYMNSDLQVFNIQPDIEYLIAVQAFFDEEGLQSPGDLCICHVKTPKKELVGNPTIAFDVYTTFTAYQVTHIPNSDCKYYYYLSSVTDEIQQYIDAYGESMYRQFMCHYGARLDVSTDDLSFTASDQNPELKYVATAIALDANGTAVDKIFRKDFELRQMPEETEAADYTISTPDKIAGSIVEFDLRLEKTCKDLRFRFLTKAEADEVMSRDEAARQAYAQRIYDVQTEDETSWYVANKKFSFDRDNNKPTGDAMDRREYWSDLAGDTEYVILYTGVNYYNEVSTLKATEAFRTKPIVRDNPGACTSDIEMQIIETDRTSVTMQFKYNTEKTALYYFQYYSPDPVGPPYRIFPDIQDGSDDARYGTGKYAESEYKNTQRGSGWMHYFLDYRNDDPYKTPWPNKWTSEGKGDQVITYRWSGFDASTTYEFAYIAEDWNGVLSPVKFCTGVTPTIEGGDNPTISAAAERQSDGTYKVSYATNDDSRQMYYLFVTSNDASAQKLGLPDLRDKNPDIAYADYIKTWEEYVLANGLNSTALTSSQTVTPQGAISVAMAIAVGGKNAAAPIYSKLATVVFTDGKTSSLEEYLGVKVAANLSSVSTFAKSVPGPAIQPGSHQQILRR